MYELRGMRRKMSEKNHKIIVVRNHGIVIIVAAVVAIFVFAA